MLTISEVYSGQPHSSDAAQIHSSLPEMFRRVVVVRQRGLAATPGREGAERTGGGQGSRKVSKQTRITDSKRNCTAVKINCRICASLGRSGWVVACHVATLVKNTGNCRAFQLANLKL